jgi:predicted deacylase
MDSSGRSGAPTRIGCDLDLDAEGRHISCLRVSHSDNRHAYGVIPVPIAMIANGAEPTALLTAGNHGDEYEGQIALRRLVQELRPQDLRGRLFVMPALNLPAVLAAERVSPIDDGNMNRSFPGDPNGGPTEMIAHYVETVLLPRCQYAVDLHSGGRASRYLPCAFLRRGDREIMTRQIQAAKVFGAPHTVIVDGALEDRSLSAACDHTGTTMVATELMGGGGVDLEAARLAREGLQRLLQHWGLLAAATPVSAPGTRFLEARDRQASVMAPIDGLFEPVRRSGERVASGDRAGWIHPMDDIDRPPVEVRFRAGGTIIAERVPPLVRRGDYLFHVGDELSEAEALGGGPA